MHEYHVHAISQKRQLQAIQTAAASDITDGTAQTAALMQTDTHTLDEALAAAILQIALTAADALSHPLVHIILHQELLVVLIDWQDCATLSDVVIQLLHLRLDLEKVQT